MGSGSANFPAKRSLMTDPNPNPSHSKFYKKKRPSPAATSPLVVPPGHVSFRLLCNASRIGGVIGKAGAVIKELQSSTGAKLRVEVAPDESPDRVISIIAPGGSTAKIALKSPVAGAGAGEEASVDVSKAQETLLRVFDRILEVAAESGGGIGFGVVSCRVLVDESQAGAVIGKGGKVVEQMRKETGCKIRVIKDNLPSCAAPPDEIIEIEGDVLAVKKGLVAVSQKLQDCSSVNKTSSNVIRQTEAVRQEILPAPHTDYTSQRNHALPTLTTTSLNFPSSSMNLPGSSVNYASGLHHHLPIESERFPLPTIDTKVQVQVKDVVFKLLCANDKIGSVIGKGGMIVQAIQKETGANVSIGSSVSECDDRLITITASENPESRYSPAQKAAVLVFSRSAEGATETKGSSITTRLLIPPNHVGCLIGKGGTIISEIRKSTGASIRLFGGTQVPKCASSTDQVLQISGEFSCVQEALYNTTGRLRDNMLSEPGALNRVGTRSAPTLITETTPYGRMREPEISAYERLRESETSAYERMRGAEISAYERMLRPETSAYERMREPETSAYERPREFAPLSFPTNKEPPSHEFYDSASFIASNNYSQNNSLNQNLDYLGLNYASDRPPSPRPWAAQMASGVSARGIPETGSERFPEIGRVGIPEVGRGLNSGKGGYELGSGNKTAIVMNTTVEIVVPENVIGSVYGENGNNLTRLRQISGARVIVHEPQSGTSDRVIIISGTPDETQAAQSLLHAFILTGPSS